jgi:hypothetical protein
MHCLFSLRSVASVLRAAANLRTMPSFDRLGVFDWMGTSTDRNTLGIKRMEHGLIGKVSRLFRNMLYSQSRFRSYGTILKFILSFRTIGPSEKNSWNEGPEIVRNQNISLSRKEPRQLSSARSWQ